MFWIPALNRILIVGLGIRVHFRMQMLPNGYCSLDCTETMAYSMSTALYCTVGLTRKMVSKALVETCVKARASSKRNAESARVARAKFGCFGKDVHAVQCTVIV